MFVFETNDDMCLGKLEEVEMYCCCLLEMTDDMCLGKIEEVEMYCSCLLGKLDHQRAGLGWTVVNALDCKSTMSIHTSNDHRVDLVEGTAGASRVVSAHLQGAVVCNAPAGVLSDEWNTLGSLREIVWNMCGTVAEHFGG